MLWLRRNQLRPDGHQPEGFFSQKVGQKVGFCREKSIDEAKQANNMNQTDKEERSSNEKSPQNGRRSRIYQQTSPLQERIQNQVRWSWREIMENTFKEIRRND